ncbi:hypothetical protein [Agrobacterium pusense]|uniref:hypothetical protein n=1 Tax=Agrobacterium pusense TaxID=648995 RepID=UPI000D1BCC6A|nr:hypothetical protein [Agrobacterium pusense]
MAFYTDGVVPWNSLDDNTRAPLTSEFEGGYPCGEADQMLFNWTAGWPIGNIWNMLLESGITPDVDKLLDLARAIQTGKVNYATSAGTANALTAALSPVPQSITTGMVIRLKISTSNTDVATLNLNGLGAAPIQTKFGAPLARGALTAGSVATLIFDGAAWRIADLSLSEIPVNFGQCRLSVQSATALLLSPYSGNSLVINGAPVKIPSAGVTLSNSGLSANTVYNVYAFLSGATLTLEASGTAHSPDSSTGVEIKSGDPTRTLVGKIRTNATSNFADTTNYRGCINWFNRRQLNVTGGSGTNSTSSSSYIDLGGSISCSFLAWGDEALFSVVNGFARSDTVGGQANISLTLDGVQGFASDSGMQAPTANYNQALISTASYTPAEGWRTLSYVGRTGGPGNMTATMAIQTIVRG